VLLDASAVAGPEAYAPPVLAAVYDPEGFFDASTQQITFPYDVWVSVSVFVTFVANATPSVLGDLLSCGFGFFPNAYTVARTWIMPGFDNTFPDPLGAGPDWTLTATATGFVPTGAALWFSFVLNTTTWYRTQLIIGVSAVAA
jgi:hypothetical protein